MLSTTLASKLFNLAKAVTPVASARVVAALVYRNRVHYIGTNKRKSHPLTRRYDYKPEQIYLHAELDCIRQAIANGEVDLSKYTLLVVRAKRSTTTKEWCYGLAKPCRGCMSLIEALGVGKLEWSK